jgi:hypothetical protein
MSEADPQALSPASIAPIDEYARRAAAAPSLNCRPINRPVICTAENACGTTLMQFLYPSPPGEMPLPSHLEQFILYLALVAILTALLSFLLYPLFCKLFKIAFPFMPDRLGDRWQ